MKSQWVEAEVESAIDIERTSGRKILYPIKIDNSIFQSNSVFSSQLKRKYLGDFTNWNNAEKYNKELVRLVKDLTDE